MTRVSSDVRALAPDLWEVTQLRQQPGLHFRLRMTVVRLADGTLWLHSPVEIDDALAERITELGEPSHLVAPNCQHHLHARTAKARYPDAKLWAAPGLAAKRPDLAGMIEGTLGEVVPAWSDGIDHLVVAGAPRVNEVVFLHRASRTLVCCDLLCRIDDEPHWLTRLSWKAMGVWRKGLVTNRGWTWFRKDAQALATSVSQLLQWEFDRITFAHGDIVEDDAKAKAAAALAWMATGGPRK